MFGDDVGLEVLADRIVGLGATDMKAGLAVMLSLAELEELDGDLALIFYVCEEVDLSRNGLRVVMREVPELREADTAILMEPTSNYLEAGCQGTMRVRVDLSGVRAHSARPWMGRNAIERLSDLLAAVTTFERREPEIDGVRYRESLSAVRVHGGVANNVIPDSTQLWLNYRFAPDLSADQARDRLEGYLRSHGSLGEDDAVVVEDAADGAPPALDAPVLGALREASRAVRAKIGWTDVSFFAAHGIPAANFGPGDPLLAHSVGEWVAHSEIVGAYEVVAELLVASEE
jgi:succinyl-diaminopimelate desuccinylase